MPYIPLEVIFGLIVIAIGMKVWHSERRRHREKDAWLERATRTDGVVSRINEREDYNPRDELATTFTVEIPVVKFRAANRIEYEFNAEAEVGKVGSVVKVAYDPDLPSSARVVKEPHFQLGCGILILIAGLVLIVLGYTS